MSGNPAYNAWNLVMIIRCFIFSLHIFITEESYEFLNYGLKDQRTYNYKLLLIISWRVKTKAKVIKLLKLMILICLGKKWKKKLYNNNNNNH